MHGCSWGGMHGCSGGACMVALGGMHGCSGVCVVAPGGMHGCSRGGMCGCSGGVHGCSPGGCTWDTTRYGDTINEWAVRILLECILVLKYFQDGAHPFRITSNNGKEKVNL